MKKLKSKFDVNVEITSTGYSAYLEYKQHESIYSTGTNISVLNFNLVEALNLLLEEKKLFVDIDNFNLSVDLQQFFEYYKVINSRYVANRIGMNPSLLSQYTTGKKRPSKKQKIKIMDGLNAIGAELIGLKEFNVGE
jgi:transcriptional regulator with XRE-family HTH domain